MNLVLIGSGNVATVFAGLLVGAGHRISAIWSRNRLHAEKLAQQYGASVLDSLDAIGTNPDPVLLAVKDDALLELASTLSGKNCFLIHTAGSVRADLLAPYSKDYGVIYPLQTLRKDLPVPGEIPLLIDASSNEALNRIRILAESISPRVVRASDEQRLQLHLAAVLVNNFTNHLYQLAAEWCKQHQLSFDLLIPLIQTTALRQNGQSPELFQTGPGVRGDLKTIDIHIALLKEYPFLQELYRMLTADLLARKQKKDELRVLKEDT